MKFVSQRKYILQEEMTYESYPIFFTEDHLQVPWKKLEFENQFQSVLKSKIQLIV